MISGTEAFILTEDEVDVLLRALSAYNVWTPERLERWREIKGATTNALDVISALKDEMRRREAA